jgi:hypothetical protein
VKNSCQFVAGFILSHLKDLCEGFLAHVHKPDTAAIGQDREDETMEKFPPRKQGKASN